MSNEINLKSLMPDCYINLDSNKESETSYSSDISDAEELTSPVVALNAHTIIIATAKAMGYKSNERGVCNGIASIALRSVILGKCGRFNGRVEDIIQLFNKHHGVAEEIAKEINGDRVLLNDFLPFFEGIELFQQAYLYPDLFGQDQIPVCTENSEFQEALLLMTTPDDLPETRLCKIAKSSSAYLSADEVIAYLKELKEVFENSSIDTPVGIQLGSLSHMIAIAYDPQTKNWLLIDSNQLPIEEVSEEECVENFISTGFHQIPFILEIHIYTLKDRGLILKTNVEAYFKSKEINQVTPEKALLLDGDGYSWLHIASALGHDSLIKSLVDAGAEVDLPGPEEHTPLHYAISYRHGSVVRTLLSANAEIEDSLLHLAVRTEDLEIVQALLDAGAEINTPDLEGDSPLHIAVHHENLEIVQALLHAGAEIYSFNINGNTPLHTAVRNKNLNIIRALLKGCAINATDSKERTPLHLAVYTRDLDAIQILLDQGARVDSVNIDGDGPLHTAIYKGRLDIVQALLTACDNFMISKRTYKDLIRIAKEENHPEIAGFLLKVLKSV